MGTTADKLQAVLDSKNAIRDKFSLADNLPFSQYADNISSGADVILGVVDAQGNFQPFEFQGIEATNSGYPEGVSVYYTWDSTLPAPDTSIGDLSFITATAEDILAGKIGADTEGNPVEGLLVKGTDVSDTTATAADVLTGKQFYDAEGTLTQGTLVPQSGGGGSATYYKCAEVGTGTWSGYKAVPLTDPETSKPYYDFEETLTTDILTYGNGFTPKVGGVYDAEALIKAELTIKSDVPTDGLVLHYNMNDVGDTVTDTVNNIVLTSNGTEIFSGATGVNGTCWGTSGGTTSYLTGIYTNTLPSVFSMNLYIQYKGVAADNHVAIVEFGNNSEGTGYGLWVNTSGQLSWRINSNYNHYASTNLTLPTLRFVMITFTYDGANVRIYQNGILHSTESCTDTPTPSSSFGLFSRLAGGDPYGENGSFVGLVDEFRFYDRVLTDEEIQQLYQEFSA